MKNIVFLLCCLFMYLNANSQAVSWELSSEPGTQITSAATFLGTNFNNCILSRGAGLTATAGAGSMNSSAWFSGTTPTTLANAIAGNDYYEFSINTINCIFFNPTTIKIVLRSSATGPNTATLRCSSDGFTTDIGTVTVTTTSTEFTFSETISPNSQSVIYRLYGYGTAAGGGTPGVAGTMRLGTSVVATDNDLQVFATTTLVTVNQVTNVVVNNGDVVPASAFVSNVPGATFDWSRTPENIGLIPTSGMGNVPSFNANNVTGSPITSTLTVHATSGNCTSVDMIYTITVNPPPCTITVTFFGNPSACNDNGTPGNPNDDFFTQNIGASFFNRPLTGSLQIVPGGDQIGVYSIPVNQIVGNSHIFNNVQLKADGTPSVVQMNFTDDVACIDDATGPTVQPCSTPPPACTITVDFFGNPSACNDNGTPGDPTDDFFTQNIHASFFNRPLTGSLQIVPGGDQIGVYSIAVNQIIGNAHTFNAVQLKADGTPSIVQMNFTDDPACIDGATGPTVQPCSQSLPCEVIAMSFENLGQCNNNGTPSSPGDDFFTADVIVFYSNPPATGNLVLSGAGMATTASVPVSSIPPTAYTFTAAHLVANGNANLITASFSANQQCATSTTTPAVNSCSSSPAVCDITNVTLNNLTSCNNNGTNDPTDDYFTASVVITFVNPPPTGNLQIEPGGDAIGSYSVPVANLVGNTHTFNNVQFRADGNMTVVEVEFTIPANQCVETIAGPTIPSCSPVCDITSVSFINVVSCNNNGTSASNDDYFTADVVINFVNPPQTGNLQLEPGGDALGTNSVPVGSLIGNSHTFNNVHFKADGTVTVVEAEFTIPANLCVQTQTGPTVQPCSNPPVLTCPMNVTVSCSSQVPPANPMSVSETHDCPGNVTVVHLGDVISNMTCTNRFTVTRTYRATDVCGNSASCQQIITVLDNAGPSMTCPAPATFQCASSVPQPNISLVTSTDNCNGNSTISFVNDVITNQTCPNKYTLTRTYRATDICGNTSICSQIITVNDNTLPLLTCPQGLSFQCASEVPSPNITLVTATDNCSGTPSISFVADVITNMTCANRFTISRIYRATDLCGNSATCTQTITVNDNTAPTITCPQNVTVQCAALVPPANTASVVTADNCGIPTVTFVNDVISNQTCINRFIITRTYRSTDACGNSTTCAQIITVFDNIVPVITFTDPLIANVANGGRFDVQCFGQDPNWDLPILNESSVSVSDNCAGTVTVGFSQLLEDEGNCPVDGYITLYRLTWTATDACGNSSSKYVFMALVDHIAPVIFNVPVDITVNCDEIPDPPTDVYATDKCISASILQYVATAPSAGCQNGQIITRSWTATDLCGNKTTETQYITLVDIEPPLLEMLHPELAGVTDGTVIQYTCNEGGIPEFYDDLNAESVYSPLSCGSQATIIFDQNTIHSVNCKRAGYLEQKTFHWYAVDNCGNESNLTVIAQLIDTEAPVIESAPDTTCIDDGALKFVDVTDNCGEAFLQYWDVKIPNPCGSGFAVRRTYEAQDHCGNLSRDTSILIPNDHIGPVLTFVNPKLKDLPPGEVLLIDCAGQKGDYTSFGVEDVRVQDGCSDEVSVSFNEKILTSHECTDGIVATLSLEWSATDLCGNLSKLIVQAFVVDHTNPVLLNFKPEITIGCKDSLPEILVTDNCGEVNIDIALSVQHRACATEYDVVRFVTATDACGNTTTGTQIIHVGDGSGPVISGVVPELCDDLSIPNVTAYDPCSEKTVDVIMTERQLESSCRDGKVYERTWTATDACGNVSTATQIIIVGDKTPPEIQIPTWSVILKYLDAPGKSYVRLSQTEIIEKLNDLDDASVYVEDECDQQVVPQFNLEVTYADDCIGEGYFEHRIYTWWATDICGNYSSVSFDVYIIDDIAPLLFGVPEDETIICAPLPSVPSISSDDPAQPVSIAYTQSIESGSGMGVNEVTREWTGTDACGNVTVSTQHITWIPDTFLECDVLVPPLVECNTHGVVISSAVTGGLGAFTYEWEVVGQGIIQSGQGTDEIAIYVGWNPVVIYLTVRDAYGCSSECSAVLDCIDSAINPFAGSAQYINPETIGDMKVAVSSDEEASGGLGELTLWPNPTNGEINLGFDSREEQEILIRLINFLGQDVIGEKIAAGKGYNAHKLEVSGIPEGSYLIEVKTETGINTKVVVIIRK